MKRIYESDFEHDFEKSLGRELLKAVAIGFVLSCAVAYGAVRLWVALQGGR